MSLRKLLFPHIYRIISAITLLLGIVGLFSLNLLEFNPVNEPRLSAWPWAIKPYPVNLNTQAKVLGSSDELMQLQQEFDYWENITSKNPDYPDAWLRLATSAYKLSKFDQAKQYLENAFILNPHLSGATQLRLDLEKILSAKNR